MAAWTAFCGASNVWRKRNARRLAGQKPASIIYLPEEQSETEVTQRTVVAEWGWCLLISGDVRDSNFCDDAVQATVDVFGWIDIPVDRVAYQKHQASIADLTDERFDRTVRTNVFGYLYTTRAAVKHVQRGGAIINTGSVTGFERSANFSIIRRPEARYML